MTPPKPGRPKKAPRTIVGISCTPEMVTWLDANKNYNSRAGFAGKILVENMIAKQIEESKTK